MKLLTVNVGETLLLQYGILLTVMTRIEIAELISFMKPVRVYQLPVEIFCLFSLGVAKVANEL